jgi:hypothetical protein
MSIIKTLRLKTGDVLAAKFDHDITIAQVAGLNLLIPLEDPIIYSSFKFVDPDTGEIVDTVSMAPYNGISADHVIIIEGNCIESISNIRPGALKRYEQFVNSLDKYNQEGDRQMSLPEEIDTHESDPSDEAAFVIIPQENKLH